MRALLAGLFALLVMTPASATLRPSDTASSAAAMNWINAYRAHPDPNNVPEVMRALSRLGAFNDPDQSGAYVGFLAGALAANPERAETLIAQSLQMRRQDSWVVVRAIAYSGLPNWRELLRHFVGRMPDRQPLIERYLAGKLPRLDQLDITPSPSGWQRFVAHFRIGKAKHKVALEPSPEALDILWGYYFATGGYGPIVRMIDLLPWSDDRDDAARLTVGSMAKYTLARNASHDQELLAMLKSLRQARHQPKETVKVLDDIIAAAENVDSGGIRQQALAAIEELKRKGPAYKRDVSWWGYVGQSTVAAGCIAAAVAGQVEFGLPCVIGGPTLSAATNFWVNQP